LLTAAGAAGGIAAAFNAPIAGVLFAAEILLGEFATAPITAMVLAAVSAALVTQVLLGPYPAFLVPAYSFRHLLELPFYLLLGVLAAGVAILYIRLLYGMRLAVERLPLAPWLRTPAGGLVLGLLGLLAPQVLGVGYDSIQTILQGQPHNPILVLEWMFLKLILTPLSLAVGFVGGVFAPALFLGAMLGYAYGTILGSLFPAWVADPSAYAMVAMAALLAGAIHAPFTATLLLFEMTRDYRIILPLMAAVGLSTLISERLQPGSLYTEALRQRGLRLVRGRDVDVLESLRVEEAMNPDVVRATQTLPVQAALEILLQRRRRTLIVETPEGRLWGITTLRDLEMALTAGRGEEPVGQICQRPVITIFPDEPVSEAVRRMSEWNIGQVPVVSREDPQRVIGIVRREEVVRAYDLALTWKRLLQYQLEQIRLRTLSGMEIVELPVEAEASAVGRPLGELPWPPECRIAVVRRGVGTLIPNGQLALQAGDRVVLIGKPEAIREAWRMLRRANHEAGPST
jgi:CIC family chloride channel protein